MMLSLRFGSRLGLAVAAGAALLPLVGARADIYVNGAADTTVQSTLAAEMQVVYAGQHFTPVAVGSPAAQEGFLANDCTMGILPGCGWELGPSSTVDFAVSLIPLTASQVSAYNAGLGTSSGPLIQFPLYGVPVTIATHAPGITANGQLVLDDGALCGIFSGQLTDWSLFSLTVPPGGFSIVYDADPRSGATWLLTQHLHAVCTATNSAFTRIPVPVTSNFASLPVPGGVAGNSRFIPASGSPAVQQALLASGSALGYIGPSYTAIAPQSPVTAALPVAALINAQNRVKYQPTVAATTSGLTHFGPGATHTAVPTTLATASDPTAWVPVNPTPSAGYPIVGYASWILSTCYASVGLTVREYLVSPFSPTTHLSIIANAGFSRIASSTLQSAVSSTFLHNTSLFNLDLQDSSTCLAYPGR